MTGFKLILPAILVAGIGYAQEGPKAGEAPAGAKASAVLLKTLETYATAKTYQSSWSFTIERGEAKSAVSMEIKSKAPSRLYFRVAPVNAQKPVPGQEPVPDMLIVIDGKSAFFSNASAAVHYKVALPKNAQVSPLMFVPQIPAAGEVELKEEKLPDGKALYVLEAETVDGSKTRMEIAADGFRIRRIVSEKMLGPIKETSTITVDKETFNAEVPDREFSFKAPRGSREMAAPPGTEALFGLPATGK